MKYQPGERFGDWLILGRSTKLQSNGKRNFRWCMCMGCRTPHRIRIGNLATGASSKCRSCGTKAGGPRGGRKPLEPRELLKRRFRAGRKRIRDNLRRREPLRWRIPLRLRTLGQRKNKAMLSRWMRKCKAAVPNRRYVPKGNSHKEKVFDNWKESIPNQLRRAATRHRRRRVRLDRWAAKCQHSSNKCSQRQRQSNG